MWMLFSGRATQSLCLGSTVSGHMVTVQSRQLLQCPGAPCQSMEGSYAGSVVTESSNKRKQSCECKVKLSRNLGPIKTM